MSKLDVFITARNKASKKELTCYLPCPEEAAPKGFIPAWHCRYCMGASANYENSESFLKCLDLILLSTK